ncbi:hypothetical protein BGZ95_006256 [Linnemannia exigua]|uniref:Uncharacterized protein n=1 Tax=Linnemannia exigua TaxID=604196 RepID=A0AAD4DG41_9FUNG|nr:hypothetical protein BGZ95_006256 [Linnemannia exigua]
MDVTIDKKILGPATRLLKVFPEELPEETVPVFVLQLPPVHAPVPARAFTPVPGHPSDDVLALRFRVSSANVVLPPLPI